MLKLNDNKTDMTIKTLWLSGKKQEMFTLRQNLGSLLVTFGEPRVDQLYVFVSSSFWVWYPIFVFLNAPFLFACSLKFVYNNTSET